MSLEAERWLWERVSLLFPAPPRILILGLDALPNPG